MLCWVWPDGGGGDTLRRLRKLRPPITRVVAADTASGMVDSQPTPSVESPCREFFFLSLWGRRVLEEMAVSTTDIHHRRMGTENGGFFLH